MSAWLLAVLLCAPASAAVVVETAGFAVPGSAASGSAAAAAVGGRTASPIRSIPGVSALAPGLTGRTRAKAAPAVRAASPAARMPAAAATQPQAETASDPVEAASSQGILPPGSDPSERPSVAGRRSDRRHEAAEEAALSSGRMNDVDESSLEVAASASDRLFDLASKRSFLVHDAPAKTASGDRAEFHASATGSSSVRRGRLGRVEDEDLRDAVASPAALPGSGAGPLGASAAGRAGSAALASGKIGAPVALPIRGRPSAASALDRLSLERGAGLVVSVRSGAAGPSAASLAGAARLPAGSRETPSPASARLGTLSAPVTSTEWLERRGLLESLSASEAAARQSAAAARATTVPAPESAPRRERGGAPLRVPAAAWLSLAFLPALLVVLEKTL